MRARLWNWKTLAPLLFILGGISCIGPLLPLPAYPHTPHLYLCVNIACPIEAEAIHGKVMGVRYDRYRRVCECDLEDSRHLPVYVETDPHKHNTE